MTILLITPGSSVRHSGNRCTASQWAAILKRQGHEVIVSYDIPQTLPAVAFDLLIAMHGAKSRGIIGQDREIHPDGKILLVLTGTDIYPEPCEAALESMAQADGIIVLQEKALEKIPARHLAKTSVVRQSAQKIIHRPREGAGCFEVCVVGHFRDVKNPLLTAEACRLLPAASCIRVRHAGGMLEPHYGALVAREQRENPRFQWLGELSTDEVSELLSSSALMVLTSHSEGGARVVGESIVQGTPVLSTRIDGVVGLLGDAYPGFFPNNDAPALAALLWRCESDPDFYARLRESAAVLAPRFAPEAERAALVEAVTKLSIGPGSRP